MIVNPYVSIIYRCALGHFRETGQGACSACLEESNGHVVNFLRSPLVFMPEMVERTCEIEEELTERFSVGSKNLGVS